MAIITSKSAKSFDCLYSVSLPDEIQRNKTILDYREIQNTINQNNLSKPIDNATINILIIDDEEDILYTFTTLLNRQGYKVKAFSNSIEAFTHFTEKSPHFYDLILMDIRMPGINGIQLYHKLRAINPYAKILLVSALDVVHELIESVTWNRHERDHQKAHRTRRFHIKNKINNKCLINRNKFCF